MTIPDATTVATPQRWWKRPKVWFMIVAGVLAVVLILTWAFSVLGGVSLGGASANASEKGAKPTSSASPSPTATSATECTDSWKILPLSVANTTNNRWFYDGIAEIKSATTDADAVKAAGVWLEQVKQYPTYLAGASSYLLDKKDVDVATLQKDGCATSAAVTLYGELATSLVTAKLITPGNVDTSAYNSGVNDGTIVASSTPGISGDLKAIKIVLADGRTVWILARCGNIATPGQPPLPTGPTDNPPPPTPQTCPPNLPHGYVDKNGKLICKDDSSVAPGTGNGSPGGGTNSDTGPGAPLPVTQPPAAPRDDPAPPAPVVPAPQPSTPSNPAPAPVPTSDPAPPPPPEPSAPPAPSPAPTCIPAPDGSC